MAPGLRGRAAGRVNARLTSSHERHQRAPRGVRREGASLDVAQIQLLHCPSEASPGRRADLREGDQREEESQRPAPFMWPDNTGPGTCRSWGGGTLGALCINEARPGPARAGGRGQLARGDGAPRSGRQRRRPQQLPASVRPSQQRSLKARRCTSGLPTCRLASP